MGLFSRFKNPPTTEVSVNQKPISLCPNGEHELIVVKKNDGVYCGECGRKHSEYTAWPQEVERRFSDPDLPEWFMFICPRCYHDNHKIEYKNSKHGTKEVLKICANCSAMFHAPKGFCVSCWDQLAKNGRCINHECARYKKDETPRLVPVYEAITSSPHCGACGQPYIVFNEKVNNRETAEIALGQNGYEWISATKGCSKCSAPFENAKK